MVKTKQNKTVPGLLQEVNEPVYVRIPGMQYSSNTR